MTISRLLLCLIWLGLGAGLLDAATLVDGPRAEIRSNSIAQISWRTDVPTGARVQFGPLGKKADLRASGPVGTNHTVLLTNLLAGTGYRYTVGSARQVFATNVFVMPGRGPAAGAATNSAAGGITNRPPTASEPAPPARMTWGQLDSLADHFDRHGGDFGARDAEHYARLAWEFRQRARREGLPAKQDEGGVIRVFEASSRSFAAYNRDGTTRTFFKPRSADYFARQPGQPVNLKQLEFRR
jgi:hypothetical protein